MQYCVEQNWSIVEEVKASRQRSHSRNPQRLGRVLLRSLIGAKKMEVRDQWLTWKLWAVWLPYNTSKWNEMEGIHTLKGLVDPGDWLVKVDLRDASPSISEVQVPGKVGGVQHTTKTKEQRSIIMVSNRGQNVHKLPAIGCNITTSSIPEKTKPGCLRLDNTTAVAYIEGTVYRSWYRLGKKPVGVREWMGIQ